MRPSAGNANELSVLLRMAEESAQCKAQTGHTDVEAKATALGAAGSRLCHLHDSTEAGLQPSPDVGAKHSCSQEGGQRGAQNSIPDGQHGPGFCA